MSDDNVTEIRHEVIVDVDIDHAFRTFTDLDRIKPREHNMLAVPIEATVVEPREGGAIYDRGTDGSTCRWARVLAWDPPHRVVFSWDIGPDWQLVSDLENASEVEVRFVAETPERTRVELEHRHIDRHGPGWEAVRDGIDDDQGWPLYLDRFAAAVAGGAR